MSCSSGIGTLKTFGHPLSSFLNGNLNRRQEGCATLAQESAYHNLPANQQKGLFWDQQRLAFRSSSRRHSHALRGVVQARESRGGEQQHASEKVSFAARGGVEARGQRGVISTGAEGRSNRGWRQQRGFRTFSNGVSHASRGVVEAKGSEGKNAEVLDVAIIGGGPGGLAAAVALISKGFSVGVFEQSPSVGRVGAVLSLFPNGLDALEQFDAETYAAVLRMGEAPASNVRMDPRGGLVGEPGPHPFSAMKDKYGQPFVNMVWYELTDILRERLPAGTVQLGRRCVGFEDSGDYVTVTFADATSAKARLLIGADGVRSVVRQQLLGDGPPDYTGIMSWRGVFDSDPDVLVPSRAAAVTNATPNGGPDRLFLGLDIQGRKTAWVAFVLQPDPPLPATLNPGDAAAHLGRIRALFSDWEAPLLSACLDATPRVLPLGIYERGAADTWSHGRVTLVGDAAHPMQPWLGQGTNTTLEDVHTLSELLAEGDSSESLRDPDALAAVLKEYERRRIQRTRVLQSWSHSAILRPMTEAPPPRNVQFMRPPEEDDWMYTYDYHARTLPASTVR